MKDLEPVLGVEEMGSFPTLTNEPRLSDYAKLMRKGAAPPPVNEALLKQQLGERTRREHLEIIEDTASRTEVRLRGFYDKQRYKDKLARVLALGGILMSGLALGIGVGEMRRPPTDSSHNVIALQSQLAQDTSRIAVLEDQLNQIKKSPTLLQENKLACLKAQIMPKDCK